MLVLSRSIFAEIKPKTTEEAVSMEKRWYVAYVKSRHEKKMAERLTTMGIEHFLPIQEVVKEWKDRKKKMQCVVIPMMIFIKATEAERLEAVKLDSVIRYMTLRGEKRPAVIPNKDMERFIFLLDNATNTVEMMDEKLKPGKLVRVIKGPLKGIEGELIEQDGKGKIIVRMELLGAIGAEMRADMVEPIEENNREK